MGEILNYLFLHLNGATESGALFVLVLIDTILGSMWRKNQGVPRTSKGALDGLIRSSALIIMPTISWLMGIGFLFLPRQIADYPISNDPIIFNIIAFGLFVAVAYFLLKSIYANAQLAGFDIPKFAIKWVEEEYNFKLDKNVNKIIEGEE